MRQARSRWGRALIVMMANEARSKGPHDPVTRMAKGLHIWFGFFFLPIILLVPISTFVLGLLVIISFGLLLVPLSLIWWLFLGPLLASSWLWIKVPLIRPIILIPGVIFSEIAGNFAALMPEMGEWESRAMKQALCEAWPHTVYVFASARGQKEDKDL